MRIVYCDACGVDAGNANRVSIPCHLYSMRGDIGYVDLDMNRVSGRRDEIDLCNACLNSAYSAMVEKIDEIRAAAPKPGGGDE